MTMTMTIPQQVGDPRTMAMARIGRRTPINTMTMNIRTKRFAAALAALCTLALPASAQDYPSKPIKVIVPYSAGGGADLLARLVSQQLSERFKQPVIVENQGGGSNTIGMRTV